MKKIIISLLSLCLCAGAKAQEIDKSIEVGDVSTQINGENLDIRFDVTASGVEINCDGQRILEFAVESADHRLVLPVVVYSGTVRYRYERRRELLSDGYHVEPYHIYKGVKKNRTYELEYRLSIPFHDWMAAADITLREYTHDCSGDNLTGSGVLLADVGTAAGYTETPTTTGRPFLAPFANLVCFLVPEPEEVKARAAMIEFNVDFPVNITEVRSDFGGNRRELSRADSLVTLLQDNDIITVNSVSITGYASPEGSYANNERLARGRADSFKRWLVRNYPDNTYVRDAATSNVPEDWDGLARMLENLDIPGKHEALTIVRDGGLQPDTKNVLLERIAPWAQNYKVILTRIYPKLRRIELRVDYTVPKLDDRQALELLYTHPEYLSLDEMYRIARLYEPGSSQYRTVYEIAARQFPNDAIANNNAAAALLQEGNADAAWQYLRKLDENENTCINIGAYHYIKGDTDKAAEYFNRAKEAGNAQAEQNLIIIDTEK